VDKQEIGTDTMGSPRKTIEEQLIDAQKIIREKNAQLIDTKKTIARLTEDGDDAQTIRENIYKIAAYDPEPPEWLAREGKAGARGVPIALWSDWHYGERIVAAEVAGVNEFNKSIAKKRVQRLVETTIDLAFNHMGSAKITYPGIVVCLMGDFLGGAIHEELEKTNDRTTQEAIEDLIDLMIGGLTSMADAFGKVFCPCVVGNHGRSTKKMQAKQRVHTSHEWNIYCALARHFKNDKRVKFLIPEEADAFFTVHNHRFMVTHGDSLGARGGDGIIGAIGPIMRGSLKTGRSEATMGRDYDTLLIGHYHQMLWLPGVIVNSSLKGFDDYARLFLRAPYSRPSQALFFLHPEHDITARWEIFLEPKAKAQQSREWITWK
jgi:hypothetical protein